MAESKIEVHSVGVGKSCENSQKSIPRWITKSENDEAIDVSIHIGLTRSFDEIIRVKASEVKIAEGELLKLSSKKKQLNTSIDSLEEYLIRILDLKNICIGYSSRNKHANKVIIRRWRP